MTSFTSTRCISSTILALVATLLTGCETMAMAQRPSQTTHQEACLVRAGLSTGVVRALMGELLHVEAKPANILAGIQGSASILSCLEANAPQQRAGVQQVAHAIVSEEACVQNGYVPAIVGGRKMCLHPQDERLGFKSTKRPTVIVVQPQPHLQANLCLFEIGWTSQANPGLGNGGHANDRNVGTWYPGNAVPRGHRVKPC